MPDPSSVASPCQRCGACCASFRVSFYRGEALPGGVPEELVQPISPFLVAMRGTEASPPRCVALLGDVGHDTACAIYARRSSTCRDFVASWAEGAPNPACDQARAAKGLPPLTPLDWLELELPSPPPSSRPRPRPRRR